MQKFKDEIITNAGGEKSLLRKISPPSPGSQQKTDVKKSSAFAGDTEGKICANYSRIPRPPLTPSYSFSETLKHRQSKGKTKKPPSMIPRFMARKRIENNKDRSSLVSKSFFLKEELNNIRTMSGVERKKLSTDSSDQDPIKRLLTNKTEENMLKISSSSFKCSQDLTEIKKEISETSCEDLEEEVLMVSLGTNTISNEEEQIKGPLDVESEAARQERMIWNFYETAKSTMGSLFDNIKCGSSETETLFPTTGCRSAPDFTNIQSQYHLTLKEMSNIWKNTISLISSVKEHAVNFVEENRKVVDKEQLTLEAEMLQLALDFAISYSKLKSDFLINLASKHLKGKKLDKSELENFMDLKIFSALYNDEDLAAMAQTVQDLNASLLRGEEFD